MDVTTLNNRRWSIGVITLLLSMMWACAGVAPIEKMAKLDSQIESARQAEAIVHAPLELKFAEDKYKMAEAAIEDGEYERASRLADEALLDAQLAEEKALSVQAEQEVQELRESIEALRSELMRLQKQY
jgi:DNA polymerase III delta prime subunit